MKLAALAAAAAALAVVAVATERAAPSRGGRPGRAETPPPPAELSTSAVADFVRDLAAR